MSTVESPSASLRMVLRGQTGCKSVPAPQTQSLGISSPDLVPDHESALGENSCPVLGTPGQLVSGRHLRPFLQAGALLGPSGGLGTHNTDAK